MEKGTLGLQQGLSAGVPDYNLHQGGSDGDGQGGAEMETRPHLSGRSAADEAKLFQGSRATFARSKMMSESELGNNIEVYPPI